MIGEAATWTSDEEWQRSIEPVVAVRQGHRNPSRIATKAYANMEPISAPHSSSGDVTLAGHPLQIFVPRQK